MNKYPRKISGKWYKPQVFLINTYEDGVFKNISRIADEKEIELAGGEEFIVLYAPVTMLEKKSE